MVGKGLVRRWRYLYGSFRSPHEHAAEGGLPATPTCHPFVGARVNEPKWFYMAPAREVCSGHAVTDGAHSADPGQG